jgi:hypothetical protein
MSASSFKVKWGRFGAVILGNHPKPPMHGGMQPPEQGGPKRQCWRCGRTPGATVPRLTQLATALLRWVASWAWVMSLVVFCLGWMFGWAFACLLGVESTLRFPVCVFWYVFCLYLNMSPVKQVFSNTSGTRSIVKAYLLKVCLFLLFWTIIGS